MDAIVIFGSFVLGMLAASFVGLAAARLNTGQSVMRGRSRCDACTTPLSPLSLVPLLSYLVQGGRAGCCGTRLSALSPLGELLLGLLFALTALQIGLSWALVPFLLALTALFFLVLYDYAHHILPMPVLAVFVALSAAAQFLLSPETFLSITLLALGVSGFLLCISIVSRGRAMGYADAPFALGLAFLVGDMAFVGLVYAFWIGAVIGIVLLLKRPRGSRMGVEVPFAPFLAAGFLLAHFTQWNPFPFTEVLRLLS